MMARVTTRHRPDPRAATDLWPAPTAAGPVRATVRVPGSKSVTNRALVLAALAEEPTVLREPLDARDTRLMAAALTALGTEVAPTTDGDDTVWTVRPAAVRGPAQVDCGLAGTVLRFVPPVAALADGPVDFDGDPAARRRPVGPLLAALRDLGVPVDAAPGELLPFTVHGRGEVRGGRVGVDASASSQLVSGLLLAGCAYATGLQVTDSGPTLPSLPHVRMTLAMLAERGVPTATEADGRGWSVGPVRPRGGVVPIEADLSNALPFAAAALVTGGRVEVAGFPVGSTLQPVAEVLEVLTALGARVQPDPARGVLVVDGTAGLRPAGELDMSAVGELVPVVAAVAALAPGRTTIRGVAHLRGHETDRLAAMAHELQALGAAVTETADGLDVRPGAGPQAGLHGGVVQTYDDHRIATAAAVLGLVVPGVEVVDVATTGKTLPGFVDRWLGMLAL
jgi:3-phosphoshikimate 1-carboxyvinyltransferase